MSIFLYSFLNEKQGNIHNVFEFFLLLPFMFSVHCIWMLSSWLYSLKYLFEVRYFILISGTKLWIAWFKKQFKWKELLLSTGIFAKYFLNGLLCPSNPEIKNISWITMTHQKIKLMWGFSLQELSLCVLFFPLDKKETYCGTLFLLSEWAFRQIYNITLYPSWIQSRTVQVLLLI